MLMHLTIKKEKEKKESTGMDGRYIMHVFISIVTAHSFRRVRVFERGQKVCMSSKRVLDPERPKRMNCHSRKKN